MTRPPRSVGPNRPTDPASGVVWPLYAAWLIALLATLGALFVGEVLGQMPCTLCWYQRIAMFPLALVLGVACLGGDARVGRYALPLCLVGAAVALWHSLLYAGVVEEALVPCSRTGPSCTDEAMLVVAGLPLPYLSLASFVAIAALLAALAFWSRSSASPP